MTNCLSYKHPHTRQFRIMMLALKYLIISTEKCLPLNLFQRTSYSSGLSILTCQRQGKFQSSHTDIKAFVHHHLTQLSGSTIYVSHELAWSQRSCKPIIVEWCFKIKQVNEVAFCKGQILQQRTGDRNVRLPQKHEWKDLTSPFYG